MSADHFSPPLSAHGYVYKVGEPISAGTLVTPDASGLLFRARPGDALVGSMGVLEDVAPGDFVAFERPRGGLGRKVRLADSCAQ